MILIATYKQTIVTISSWLILRYYYAFKKMTFTSFPVGTCLASLTLAKLPLPMVLSSLYLPICGSSDERLRDDPRVLVTVEALLPPPTPPPPPPTPPPPPPPVELLFVAASLPCKKQNRNKLKTQFLYCTRFTDNELNKKI